MYLVFELYVCRIVDYNSIWGNWCIFMSYVYLNIELEVVIVEF